MKRKYLMRIIILVVVVGAIFAVINFGKINETPIKTYINLQNVFQNRDALLTRIEQRMELYSVVYIVVYIGAVALSIPGASILSILGGFFFGAILATLYINIGATIGALIIFIAARFFIGEMVQKKYGEKLKKFNKEMEENGTNYLITLRLIPIFPFFLINLFAGVTKVKWYTFLWTTSLGIIPGSFAYAYSGFAVAKLGAEPGVPKNLIFAFLLLAVLSIIPLIYKKLKAKKQAASASAQGA
jgi:uncharacterized membrane protein YdjX (TVP38/TMEM64 family)